MIFSSEKRYNIISLLLGKEVFYTGLLEEGKRFSESRLNESAKRKYGQAQASGLFRKVVLASKLTFQEASDKLEPVSKLIKCFSPQTQIDYLEEKNYSNSVEYEKQIEFNKSIRGIIYLNNKNNKLESLDDFLTFTNYFTNTNGIENKYIYDIISKTIIYSSNLYTEPFDDVTPVNKFSLLEQLNIVWENI